MADQITTLAELRERYGDATGPARDKQIDHVDDHCRALIARSPFALLATADADGRCDVTPRGGTPGFCRVLDDGRLAIPDVKGNRRTDSLANILSNPRVGLLFLVPRLGETLRVNGAALISTDPQLIDAVSDPGKPAITAIVVEPDEVFVHCAKALIRSSLWNPATWPDSDEIPSAAAILRDHMASGASLADVEAHLADSYENRLY